MSHSILLIRNGTIVNDDCMTKADVLVEDGKITTVGENLVSPKGDVRVLDATDRYVIPGGIDPHTHMQLPFMGMVTVDDYYHGTRAALSAEMEKLTSPEYGINSFKFYLAYKDDLMVDDDGLKQCAKIGALARVHAENGSVIAEKQKELLELGVTGPEGHTQTRPEELEAEATNRACVLAGQANCPLYVVHVMSKGAARVIAQHRQNGQVIFGEPIAAGLVLDGSHYYNKDWTHAAAYIMSHR
uniref:Amidohydrolase-related domain-containing protein n=1 Tax=Ditylenchus dipsaci TaxID=166011 RepID=A0A915DW20_9BILA